MLPIILTLSLLVPLHIPYTSQIQQFSNSIQRHVHWESQTIDTYKAFKNSRHVYNGPRKLSLHSVLEQQLFPRQCKTR